MFAAQFALSRACGLITYLLTGWAGATLGPAIMAIILAPLAGVAIGIGLAVWLFDDPEIVEHCHDELSADHPHLANADRGRDHRYAHVIDDMHPACPAYR